MHRLSFCVSQDKSYNVAAGDSAFFIKAFDGRLLGNFPSDGENGGFFVLCCLHLCKFFAKQHGNSALKNTLFEKGNLAFFRAELFGNKAGLFFERFKSLQKNDADIYSLLRKLFLCSIRFCYYSAVGDYYVFGKSTVLFTQSENVEVFIIALEKVNDLLVFPALRISDGKKSV